MKKTKDKKSKSEEKDKALNNLRQENFCKFYLFGFKKGKKTIFRMGNGTLSYMKAYDLKESQYNHASVNSHDLLRNTKIKKRMRELLEDNGFNDQVVDARLTEIIKDASPKDSNMAIKTYNELQKRIDTNNNFIIVDGKKKGELNKALDYLHDRRK